ncbi:MAG: TIGR03435 family protein [Acidobacteriia bacterium]|nr:TIGR03435 family protein [Terriglobia bacterium]
MKSQSVSLLLAVLAGIASVQGQSAKPTFEVASIKPSDPNPENTVWIGMDANAGTVRYTNITLRDCIRAAYRVRDFQVEGPDWIRDARYEITAKLGVGTQDQIPEMLQSLLEERFRLSLRRGTKDQQVNALVLGKDGSRLKVAEANVAGRMTALGPDGKPRPAMSYAVLPSGVRLRAPAATLATVVEFLSRLMERPVVDMTGLSGQYDLTLTFMPEIMGGMSASAATNGDGKPAFPEPGPSLFDAVQQYGLKLEARKAPMELLTVVHAERTPTEN